MTIALGFCAQNTIVLAADTEVTIEDEMKSGEGKIRWFIDTQDDKTIGTLAVTGAGDVFFLEFAAWELFKIFKESRGASTDELEALFRTRMRKIYQEEALRKREAEIELIIAAQRMGEFDNVGRIWTTNKSTMTEVRGHVCVGIGSMQGDILLKRLRRPCDTLIGKLLAAYVIFQIKQLVPGCGGETDVFCLDGGLPVFGFPHNRVRGLESIFRKYSKLEANLVHNLIGSPYDFADTERIHSELEHLRTELKGLLDSGIRPVK